MTEPLRVGTADARRRFSEILDRVEAGETVEVTRRNDVVAVIGPPNEPPVAQLPFGAWIEQWRSEWGVADWPDDDPFANLRDLSPGRPAPW